MPARNTDISVVSGTWTALSDGAVSACRVNNFSGYTIILEATATNTPPTDKLGGQRLASGVTLATDLTLAQIFPGVGAGAMFLWAFSDVPVMLSVSHA